VIVEQTQISVHGSDMYHSFDTTWHGFRELWIGIVWGCGSIRNMNVRFPKSYKIIWGWDEPGPPPGISR
jgi:hypothetical protein